MRRTLLVATLLLVASAEANQSAPTFGTNSSDQQLRMGEDLCGLSADGSSTNRILNGEPAAAGEFPWTVSLFTYKPPLVPFFCMGTLINRGWVLTNSGCVKDASHFSVFLGAYNLSAYEANRIVVYATEYYVEPRSGYLALIQLSTNVTYNEYVRPVCLPAPDAPDHTGDSVILSGWGNFLPGGSGFSQVLRKAETTIVASAMCSKMSNAIITDDVICTNSSGGQVICAGDQGSALIYRADDGRHIQIGVALLFASGSCYAGQLNGFTNVRPYLRWINQIAMNSATGALSLSHSGGRVAPPVAYVVTVLTLKVFY